METKHLTADDTDKWWKNYERVGKPGPYHRPDYLQLLAGNFEHDNEHAEVFILEDGDDIIYYPYIRRSLGSVPFAHSSKIDLTKYDDIVSSWYYGGPFSSKNDNRLCGAFAQQFDNFCKSENIVAEFVRFDPNERNYERFDCLEPKSNRETVPVDLTKNKETLWDEFEKRKPVGPGHIVVAYDAVELLGEQLDPLGDTCRSHHGERVVLTLEKRRREIEKFRLVVDVEQPDLPLHTVCL